jgi:hypothetical protein
MKVRRIFALLAVAAMAFTAEAKADWAGGYIGGYGGFFSVPPDVAFLSGIQGGYAFSNGRTVVGIEGEFGLIANVGGVIGMASVAASLGFIVGERAIFYAVAGAGGIFTLGAGAPIYSFGAGIEFQVGTRGLTMFIEPRALGQAGMGAGCCAIMVQTGINWRP